MFGRSHKLRGLLTAAQLPLWPLQRSQSQPRLAPAPCTPPAGADGWLLRRPLDEQRRRRHGVTDRLVDDYFRDVIATSAPTSEGIAVRRLLAQPGPVSGVRVRAPGGFDWGDFGIGIAVAVGAMLLAMGVSNRAKGQRRLGIGRA